jgi:hypothetical protein
MAVVMAIAEKYDFFLAPARNTVSKAAVVVLCVLGMPHARVIWLYGHYSST